MSCARFQNVRRAAAVAGRDPDEIELNCCLSLEVTDEAVQQEPDRVRGTPEQIAEALERFEDVGVRHAALQFLVGRYPQRLAQMERLTRPRRGRAEAPRERPPKHGAVGLTRAVASELAGSGVRVNVVCPTFVRTELTERTIARIVETTGRSESESEQALAKQSPLGRLLEPEEVADAVVFLASPATGAINGKALVIDGGGIQS